MWCSASGAIRYLTGPARLVRAACTSGVRAMEAKTAREPERRRTCGGRGEVSVAGVGGWRVEGGVGVPIVPRPPTLKRPKREKGAEQVMMLGVTLRMTITSDGLDGMSFDDMLVIVW